MFKTILLFLITFLISISAFSATDIRRPTGDNETTGTPGYFPGTPTSFFSHVSETTRDDYAYVYWNGTPGALLFDYSAFSVPSTAQSISLTIYFTSAIQSAGFSTMGVAVRVSGTAYPIAESIINPTTSFEQYAYQLTTNPDTGVAWTIDDINGIGTNPLENFGIYSNDCSPIVASSWVYAEVSYVEPTATITPTITPTTTPTATSTPIATATPFANTLPKKRFKNILEFIKLIY